MKIILALVVIAALVLFFLMRRRDDGGDDRDGPAPLEPPPIDDGAKTREREREDAD